MGIHWESVHVSRAAPHSKQGQRTVIQLCGAAPPLICCVMRQVELVIPR